MQQKQAHGALAAAIASPGLQRSDKWPGVEKAHLQQEPACVVCGSQQNLQVHHVLPFHFCILLGRPELELDQRNLITLCEGTTNHHLLLGHLDDWETYNQDVRSDVAGHFKGMQEAQIQTDSVWLQKKANRPPVWANMTDDQKTKFKLLMDTLYPPQP